MNSIPNNSLIASRQLTSRPSGSYEINAREYGSAAATAIGLAQAACQGGENAVSSIVHLSEQGLQALQHGVKDVADAVVDGAGAVIDEVTDIGSTVAGYATAGAVAAKALLGELT